MKTEKNTHTSDQIISQVSLQRFEELVSLFVRSTDCSVGALFCIRPGYISLLSQVGEKGVSISESFVRDFVYDNKSPFYTELKSSQSVSEICNSDKVPSYGLIGVDCVDEVTQLSFVLLGLGFDEKWAGE